MRAGARFDVKTKGPYEILVSSLWAGGMMGSITVWACDQAWCGDDDSQRRSSSCKLPRDCWHLGCTLPRVPAMIVRTGGHGYDIAPMEHWTKIASRYCPPSW